MGNRRFTKYVMFLALLLSGMMISCQKDQVVSNINSSDADSSTLLTSPENVLAVKGTLSITIQDSTYVFDAAKDSVAFVNVHSGNDQYFGITAINKAHNMSFGISSAGYAVGNTNTTVAGSQFIVRPDKSLGAAYTLTNNAGVLDIGKLLLTSYKKDSVLAKGTFYTFLAKDAGTGSPFYKVKGEFSLQVK